MYCMPFHMRLIQVLLRNGAEQSLLTYAFILRSSLTAPYSLAMFSCMEARDFFADVSASHCYTGTVTK